MLTVSSYPVAVLMCFVTMLCWGSWGNTQKLASREWKFQLFYWDYAVGILLFSLFLALTMGSLGSGGRAFVPDMMQADAKWLGSAFIGGVIFNAANLLLVIAIDIAGLAVAFPVGIGLALVLGVITTYLATGVGNPAMLFPGGALIAAAIVLDAMAFRRMGGGKATAKGVSVSLLAGILMGFFYSFVASSMGKIDASGGAVVLEAGKLSPYSAMFVFAVGIFASNFVFNTLAMRFPISGDPVPASDYFKRGTPGLHLVGMLGGAVWCLGSAFSFIASDAAGAALAYGLGQGATMVSALWGVFVWKEFRGAPKGTNALIFAMFALFAAGLAILIASK